MGKKSRAKRERKEDVASWRDVAELVVHCDAVVRQSAAAVLAMQQSGHLKDEDKVRLTETIVGVKNDLKEIMDTVPADQHDVQEHEYPTYLYIYSRVSDVKDRLFDQLMPDLARVTEVTLDAVEGGDSVLNTSV